MRKILVLLILLLLPLSVLAQAPTPAQVADLEQKATAGDAQAQDILGLMFMYAEGQGVPQDAAKAIEWYEKAAGQGYASAQYNLGVMYHLGLLL